MEEGGKAVIEILVTWNINNPNQDHHNCEQSDNMRKIKKNQVKSRNLWGIIKNLENPNLFYKFRKVGKFVKKKARQIKKSQEYVALLRYKTCKTRKILQNENENGWNGLYSSLEVGMGMAVDGFYFIVPYFWIFRQNYYGSFVETGQKSEKFGGFNLAEILKPL